LDLTVRKTWYLVANRSEARIFQDQPRRGFGLVSTIENPEARLPEAEFDSDRPGRIFSSTTAGRGTHTTIKHGLGRGPVRKEGEAIKFATQIVRYLEQEAQQRSFEGLVLVAEPRFLGFLRGKMSRTLGKLVARVLRREFPSHVSERELRVILRQSA